MQKHSRRQFLKHSALAGSALALAPFAAHGQAQPAEASAKMTIAKWSGGATDDWKNMSYKLAEQAIQGLGGMGRFVSKGDVVWVKPNIAWDRSPEQAANTNPFVVAALVKMCLEAGAKQVKVGDHTCNKRELSYANSGIADMARDAGADVLYVDPERFREVNIGGKLIKSIPLYTEITDCDLVINVPIVKHHGSTTVSLCMKNYMGVVDNRQAFHQDLPTSITDITRYMQPRLCVLDATRMLIAHGPTGGDLGDVKAPLSLAAGSDIVALDAWGCELLGLDPKQIGSVVAGSEAGLGVIDYKSLTPKELAVA